MVTTLYQEYLFVIGKLKDIYKLDIDVDHENIHTFYKDKKPLFKLFFGMFSKEDDHSIVVSFHMDLIHAEAIQWFIGIYKQHPLIKIHDSYVEDDNGETYLGEDALAIREVAITQEILGEWLDHHTVEEMDEFRNSKVVGRIREPDKSFNSQIQKSEAIIEFERIKKPGDGYDIH